MENEDEALDLLLSLQSEEAVIPESPRGTVLEDESGGTSSSCFFAVSHLVSSRNAVCVSTESF
jgi:hypothetical protein